MKKGGDFLINRYDFDQGMFDQFDQIHFVKEYWPIVYVLSDGAIKEAYVGETTDTYARMSVHIKTRN